MNRPQIETLFLSYRASGDPKALAQVFDLAAPEIYELARRLSRERADAEDLLQDTFVTAIEKRANWDEREPLLPWLVGILAILSQRRRRERARVPDPGRVAQPEVERPDEVLEAGERQAQLMVAIAELRPDERSLIEQRILEGWSPAKLARELELPATTLRMRLSRALARLRRRTPRSLSWGLVPTWSRRAALRAVRAKLVPGAPLAAPKLAPLATALVALAVVGGAIGVVACLAPERPPEAKPQPTEVGQSAARPAEPLPEPKVITIGPPPPKGQLAAPPTAADAPRTRVHLVVTKNGKPHAGAELVRPFPDNGFESFWPRSDALGRIEIDLITDQPPLLLCMEAEGCAREILRLDPAQLWSGETRTVDLRPGPLAVRVRFVSPYPFPKGFTVCFVPLGLLGDRRPDADEMRRDFSFSRNHVESPQMALRADGTTEVPVPPGHYWVLANLFNQPTGEPLELPSSCFEVEVPEGHDVEIPYAGRLGSALVLDVLGPATIGMDVSVTLDDGPGTERKLNFWIGSGTGFTVGTTAINVGTLHARSEPIPAGEHTLVFKQRSKEIDRRRVVIVRGEELKLSITP